MAGKPDRTKNCVICKKEFYPMSTTAKCCSWKCALKFAEEKKRKAEAKELRKWKREVKDRLKTKTQWLAEAQEVFNRYVRLRDFHEPCISCGTRADVQYHAGHYRSIGACPELRFDETNVHKQCAQCNNHRSGNIVEYRLNLVERIGTEALERLEGHHELPHWTVDEIKAIKAKYKKKIEDIVNQTRPLGEAG